MIKTTGSFTPAEIDKKIENINRILKFRDTPLKFSSKIKYSQLTGDAAIIQLFLHWAKLSKDKRVFTNIQQSDQSAIDDMLRTPWGLATAFVGNRFYAKDGATVITKKIDDCRNSFIANSNFRFKLSRNLKGPVFAFFCADHLGFHSDRLYIDENTIRSRTDYTKLVVQILNEYVPSRRIYDEEVDNVGEILRELVENTGDHGRHYIDAPEAGSSQYTKRRVNRSLRGLVTRKVNFRNIEFDTEGDGAPALKNYFLRLKGETDKRTALYFSVFDNGGGYASSFLGKPVQEITFADELSATKKCFIKNVTTKKGNGYGQGLARTLNSLKFLEGLLILRTGRVILHINPKHFSITDESSIERCISWYSDGEIKPQNAVSGTAITIVIPV